MKTINPLENILDLYSILAKYPYLIYKKIPVSILTNYPGYILIYYKGHISYPTDPNVYLLGIFTLSLFFLIKTIF